MKKKNLFWGIMFLFAGTLVILGQLDLLEMNIYTLLASVFLGCVAAANIWSRNFFMVVPPIGIIVWLNRVALQMPTGITLWNVLFASALLSVGLSLIFKRKNSYVHFSGHSGKSRGRGYKHHGHHRDDEDTITQTSDEDFAQFSTKFAASSQYLYSSSLKKVDLECSFGSTQVYFEQCTPAEEGADVWIDAKFAGVELYIPHEWNIQVDVDAFFGGVDETNRNRKDATSPILRLHGDVKFGAVNIIYI